MKRTIFIALFLGIPMLLAAQVTNEGFEEWEPQGDMEMPVGWNNSSFGVGKDVTAYSGESAVRVWNWYTYALGYVIADQTGLSRSFALDQGGVPIEYVPERLTGYYKFERGDAPDTAVGFAVLMFRRHNPMTGGSDTVSFVKHPLPPSTGWQMFDVSIPRSSSGLRPDTMVVGFFSTDPTLGSSIMCNPSANECCYLSIDEVALVSSSGVSRPIESLLSSVQVLPNPVTDAAVFRFGGESGMRYRVMVYDASGRLAGEREFVGPEAELSGLGLSAGAYHATVVDASGSPVAGGRFVVE